MFNSVPTSTVSAASALHSGLAPAGWNLDDDVAFGCECADPSLQIDSWGQDTGDGAQGLSPAG